MIEKINFYFGESNDPHYNLAVEQYLLENVPENACTLYLWQNKHTVVIGRNQNAWKECRTEELTKDGGYLARRLSGGGAVFHDLGNLNFTFLVSKKNYDLDRQLNVIAKACEHFGIHISKSGRNDLLADGRKFSGNAYYDSQGKAYHHGTILIDVDMSMLSRYLKPSKAKLDSKGVDSVASRVINLKELCPDITIADMKTSLVSAFESVYGLKADKLSFSDFDSDYIQKLYERNSSWEWLYGRKIPFSFSCEKRFSWGELELQAQVDKGIFEEVMVYSDSMDWNITTAIANALTGCRMNCGDILRRIESLDCDAAIRKDISEMIMEQEI